MINGPSDGDASGAGGVVEDPATVCEWGGGRGKWPLVFVRLSNTEGETQFVQEPFIMLGENRLQPVTQIK